ncbi:MAG: hypothetical protein FGM34_03420 [Solirubrobacteraceae bacterium]|nr:hypothetical protein [Solirubrobacteraceae bacterium]
MRSALLAICGLLAAVPVAHAGEYTVYACRADDGARNNSWRASNSSGHLAAYPDGCSSGGGGLVARAGVEPPGSFAPAFASATWRFDAPAGSSVSQVALSGRLYRAPGARWGVGLSDQSGNYLLGGISGDAMAWESGGYAGLVAPASTTLYFGVLCADGSGCPTTSTGQSAWGYARARADLYGVRVRVSEAAGPSIGSVRGSLVGGSWVGGTASIGFDAGDPVGVARQSLAVSEVSRSDPKACDYTLPAPCPTSTGTDYGIDTRSIPDGAQAVSLAATDTAGNSSTWSGTAYVDNNAPGAPSQPTLQGRPASEWRATNGFTLSYDNPSRSGGAPLNSHDVQVCPTDPSGTVDPAACTLESRPAAPGTDTVSLPRPGRFRVRVRVNDSLYAGAWSPWSEMLRFDDAVPAAPSAAFPAAWVNAASAGGGLFLSVSAAKAPVSGIRSFVVTGLPEGERTIEAASPGSALVPFTLFPEGPSSITVRAVSGSGLATDPAQALSGTVRKDTVAPGLAVTGAPEPGATVAREVTLTAIGSDQVSGMAPAPADRPVTDGAFISFLAPGSAPTRFRGPDGRMTPGEGARSFAITATDVAGNESPATRVSYTQDTRVPTGGLLPVPAESPSAIRFSVSESCAGRAAVEISTAPGEWEELPTTLADGVASSRVPATVWDSETPYTLRAAITDCAGNQAVLDRWAAGPLQGEPIGQLTPPRRTATSARAELGKPGRGARASSATRTVSGTVRTADGKPLAGARVLIETQPRASGQQWRTLAEETTSRTGYVSHAVTSTHSELLRIAVVRTDLIAPSFSNVLRTTVKAASSISARPARLRNGRRVTLSGRLRGGFVPNRFEVSLFGQAPGSRRWVPVRTPVPVSRSGSWKASYRFTRTRVRSRYRFRLRIPGRPDYPFSAGYSPVRTVTVLP